METELYKIFLEALGTVTQLPHITVLLILGLWKMIRCESRLKFIEFKVNVLYQNGNKKELLEKLKEVKSDDIL
jgi:hypothetical protein